MSPKRPRSSKRTARASRGDVSVGGYVDRSSVGFEAGEGDPPPLRNHAGLITDDSYIAHSDGHVFEESADSGDIFLDDESADELEWEASAEKR